MNILCANLQDRILRRGMITRGCWQECVREQDPVFFDSLVLPNPRGLVRYSYWKIFKQVVQVRVEVEAGRNLPANDMVQPQTRILLFKFSRLVQPLHDLI